MRTTRMRTIRRGIAAVVATTLAAAALSVTAPLAANAAANTIDNPSFETGDLTGWTVASGSAFSDANVSDATDWGWGCCFNPDGTYHLWGAASGGDAPTGTLRSSDFTLGGIGEISFLIGGGNDIDNLYVALRRSSDDTEIRRATNTAFADSESLSRVVWDVSDEIGENLYLEVVDNASGGWGHINLDDVRTYAESSITAVTNPGFETGDLSGWSVVSGDAFTDAHVSSAIDWGWGGPFDQDGTYHLWGAATGGDAPVGELRSSTFTLTGTGTIEFLIGGGNDIDNLFVALHRASDGAELLRATNTAFADSEGYSLVRWNAAAHLGHDLYFSIVDTATGGWGHINVDAFDTNVEVLGYEFDNADFESGKLDGWSAEGEAFTPSHVSDAATTPDGKRFDAEGAYHLWGGALGSDEATGTLTSPRFRIGGRAEVQLLLGGSVDDDVYAVVVSDEGSEIARATVAAASDTYQPVTIDLADHHGEVVRLRLVDASIDGHLNADAVRTLVNDPMHWSFDEGTGVTADGGATAADPIEYVFNDAAFKPDSEPLWTGGVAGGALLFDGYSTVIERKGAATLTPSSTLSIEAWVAPRSYEWGDLGQASAIVNQHDAKAKTGYLLGMYRHGEWGVELGDGVNWHTLRAGDDAILPTYQWSHVAATYQASTGTMTLYLNGEPVAEKNIGEGTRILAADAKPLLIGRHNNAAVINGAFRANMWNGAIDELTVTDAALTAADIAADAEAGAGAGAPEIAPARDRFDGDRYRPQYHFLPPEHWMNEPHAPVYYDGKYHIFYQHNPQGPYWHQIHWGHAISDDMVHWEDLPVAIAPTEPVTPDGVWSGSATLDADGKPVLFYTAGNDSQVPNQATGLAWPVDGAENSDLTEWTLEPTPVTAQAPDLASPVGTPWFGQFRDPFVWKETADDGEPIWYQIVGSGILDGDTRVGGTALLYTSRDLVNWEYRNPLFIGDAQKYPKTGQVWELPVLLPVGTVDGVEKHVLVVNPWFDGYNINTAKNTYYWVGEWDRDTFSFVPDHEEPRMWDYGEHFTGPSGMVDPDGRSILFTITQDGRSETDHYNAGWAHSMGLPVALSALPSGDVGLEPIEELESLRSTKVVDLKNTTVAKANATLDAKHDSLTDLLEVELELQIKDKGAAAGLEVRRSADGTERTILTVDRSAASLTVDRTFSSLDPDARKGGNSGEFVVGPNGKVTMRVYVDRSVIEAFVDGRKSLTTRVYPTLADAVGLRIVGDAKVQVKSLRVWNLDGAFGPVVAPHFDDDPVTTGAGLPNGDFATCDFTDWTVVEGDAFSDATVTDADDWGWGGTFRQANAWGSEDRCHLWGFDEAVGDGATGTLRSATVTLGGDGQVDLLTAGGYDPDNLYVAAVRAADGAVLAKVSGNEQEPLRAQYQRRGMNLSAHVGEEIYLKVVDRATGGWGHISVDDINVPTVEVDRSAPVAQIVATPEAPDGTAEWHVSPVTLAVEATDDIDAEPQLQISIDGGEYTDYAAPITVESDGEHTFTAIAIDAAGNASETATWTGRLDQAAPTVTARASLPLRELTLAAKDTGSGVASIEYALITRPGQRPAEWTTYSVPVPFPDRGTLIAYRATDVAGNTADVSEFDAGKVKPVKTTTTAKASTWIAAGGRSVTYIVDVRARDGEAPVGTVEVRDGHDLLTTVELTADQQGRAQLVLPPLRRGMHLLTARFTGSGFTASISPPSIVVVF